MNTKVVHGKMPLCVPTQLLDIITEEPVIVRLPDVVTAGW